MKNKSFHKLGLKLIALALAVITWFYVNGELVKQNANVKTNYQENR